MPKDKPLAVRYSDWPAADRAAWDALFAEGDILDGAGPARHWALATRRTNLKHYGRWLGWLSSEGNLDAATDPCARVNIDLVTDYARSLIEQVAPRTAASVLIGLKVVVKAMAPERSWRWLMDLTNRVNTWAKPLGGSGSRVPRIEDIHAACARELDRPLTTPLTRRIERVAYRDALLALVLSAAPIRLRNLASIEIGTQLLREASRVRLRFLASETKNRQPLMFTLPWHVAPYLDAYLDRIRPSFNPAPGCYRLWLGFEGQPLTAHSIYGRIILVTRRILGAPINRHRFRACAATSFAMQSPGAAREAAALLGHRHFGTTERHYIKADQLEASQRINAKLSDIRNAQRRRV